VEYIINGIIYSALYFNTPEHSNNIFTFFHVLNKKQLVNFIFIPVQYISDFFMIGYLISWKFKALLKNIFTIDKIKKTYILVIFAPFIYVLNTPNWVVLFKRIPHLISLYFAILNPYYFIFSLKALILAPLFEEIIYRGIIYNSIKNKYGFIIALISSALIFGSAHIGVGKDWYIIGYILIGLLFAYIYEKTDQLFWSMMMHSLFNFMVTIKQFS